MAAMTGADPLLLSDSKGMPAIERMDRNSLRNDSIRGLLREKQHTGSGDRGR